MWKALVCLFLGHLPFTKIETVTHPPRAVSSMEMSGTNAAEVMLAGLRTIRGYTTVSLMCPGCNKIKVIEQ